MTETAYYVVYLAYLVMVGIGLICLVAMCVALWFQWRDYKNDKW